MKYQLTVKINSEAIFNSGDTDGNIVQMKVLTDQQGFVYYHAKSLKGQLKDVAMGIYKEYKKLDLEKAQDFLLIISELFGLNKEECKNHNIDKGLYDEGSQDSKIKLYEVGKLKVGHLQLDGETKDFFNKWFELQSQKGYTTLSKHELIQAQTNIRTNIAIENGIVKKGGLVNFHTVREGLTFFSELEVMDASIEDEKITEVLKLIAGGFRRIGANTHRGRGCIEAKIEKMNEEGA